ncbi:MAG: ABC transporter permease [Rhodococcus sp. (in: high G+C Gram-positive bacteria)]|uniref:ABC transporter permease n=1 Tax=Rhodococcus sp. TaxID=1831 RepID=UPI003BB81006
MSGFVAGYTPLRQWWVLTDRGVRSALRGGSVVTALIAPVVFTLGFYVPLHAVVTMFSGGSVDYGRFLMPLLALQAVSFTAITAAFVAATDAVRGVDRRFATMPIAAGVPVAARVSASAFRCVLALVVAVVCGHLIGFRFDAGPAAALGFCVLALLIGVVLTFVADAVGALSRSPEATTRALAVPQLVLGMLSCGFLPLEQFPQWSQPIVRNQPVSQFSIALRSLADGTADARSLLPTVLWLSALLAIVGWMSVRGVGRRS